MKILYFVSVVLFHFLVVISAAKVPSPRSYHDKIAIVGAGASGIHMALALKKKGFTDVEILEKTAHLGGKSWTINYRGVNHEMGAVYLAPDYQTNVIPLVNQYLPGDMVYLPNAGVDLDELKRPIKFEEYVALYAMRHFNTSDVRIAISKLVDSLDKYIKKHEEIFGRYEGDLMPEPTPEVMKQIGGTFVEFLKRNNIDAIAPILYAASSVQGYGRLDEIACLYGMMWNTPKLMTGILKRLRGFANETGLYMLKSGFGALWRKIVKKENLNVIYNVDILEVYRTKHNNYKDIWIKLSVDGGRIHRKHYDFLIWSPEMKTSLPFWANKEIYKETFYFSKTHPTFFTTALADTDGVEKGPSPVDYFFDNLNKKREGSVLAQRDTYAALHHYSGARYQKGEFPSGNDNETTRTTVTYQMNDREESYTKLRQILRTSLKKIGATSIMIIRMKIWRYFPRYSPADVEKGYLWRVFEMQGKYGMWYIGSSVSFESVKSVIEYNKMILRNMELPKTKRHDHQHRRHHNHRHHHR